MSHIAFPGLYSLEVIIPLSAPSAGVEVVVFILMLCATDMVLVPVTAFFFNCILAVPLNEARIQLLLHNLLRHIDC